MTISSEQKAITEFLKSQTNTYGHMGHVIEYKSEGSGGRWETLNHGNMHVGYSNLGDGIYCYYSGKEAAEQVAYLKTRYGNEGRSYRITRFLLPQSDASRIEANNTWKQREATRLSDGTYTPLPFAEETWFKARHVKLNHFAHVSTLDPGKVAFTETETGGQDDRQQQMSIGRYLRTYYSETLGRLPPMETGFINVNGEKVTCPALDYYVKRFQAAYGGQETLHFATTADEMEEVYLGGPDSCMAKDDWVSGIHPVRVYAAGDLHLAYMKDPTGRITARALVWPDKMLVGRLYGDDYSLRSLLTERGYTCGDWNCLKGARLLKIPAFNGHVMPYIDGEGCYHHHEDGVHFAIGSYTSKRHYPAAYQYGLDHEYQEEEEEEGTSCCDLCGNSSYNDDIYTVFVTYGHGPRVTEAYWCSSCYEYHAFTCEETSNTYSNDIPHTYLANGRIVANINLDDYFQCDVDGEWYHTDNYAGSYEGEDGGVAKCNIDTLVLDYSTRTYWRPENLPAEATNRAGNLYKPQDDDGLDAADLNTTEKVA